MSEADSGICKRKGEWSSMPYDLLSNIANRLELVDFTNFHHVCKNWCYATEPLLEAKFCGYDPLFLFYGEGSRCSVLNNNAKVYTTEIPELDGAVCLASYDGWLLVFCDGSLFFFCPFSRAKIQLPNCPITESHDCYGAFSSAPTSQDCIVAVFKRSFSKLELHTLCRGDDIWVKHQQYSPKDHTLFPIYTCALFIEGEFIYANNKLVFIFDAANTKQWSECRINDESVLKCRLRGLFSKKARKEKKHRSMDLKRKLGLNESDTLSICGTLYDAENMLWSEYIPSIKLPESRCLEGVWVLPRYHKNQDQRR